jgi:CPA1 family monovalent cation:H+ antiporter
VTDTDTIRAVEAFVILLGAASLVAVATRRVTALPYSVALVILGTVVAALHLPLTVQIGPQLLLAVLLPALVFEGAYRTDIRRLWQNLPVILFLAVPGVLVTAGLTAVVLHQVVGLDLGLAFLAGTMLAATDPAAILAVFKSLGASRRLSTVVEAESLFNDGTGIVIFVIALAAIGHEVTAGQVVVDLVRNIVVSTLLGAAFGFVASWLLSPVRDHLIELTVSVVAAYGSYLLAVELGQSGLIATVVCGLILGSYGGRFGLSSEAKDAIDTVWEFIGFLATTLVFLLVGLSIGISQLLAASTAILAALAALLVSRGVMVYGVLGGGERLLRRFGRVSHMPPGWLHLVAWSGLRGAVAIALALSLPLDLPQRDLLQGIVFGCVLLTLLLQGTTAQLLVRHLGLGADEEPAS